MKNEDRRILADLRMGTCYFENMVQHLREVVLSESRRSTRERRRRRQNKCNE